MLLRNDSPAFDVMYSDNPAGAWTSRHQMSLKGKRDGFDREDFRARERTASMKRGRADTIVDEVIAAVSRWWKNGYVESFNGKLRGASCWAARASRRCCRHGC